MSLIPSDEIVDNTILAVVQPRNLKVAMVIVIVDDRLVEAGYGSDIERIGSRIEAMAEQGRIRGFGILQNWRHSEVCQNEQ
jgi:hypothetical protein